MDLPVLTAIRLRKELDYDPKTGIFIWNKTGRGRRLNRIAGTVGANGYITINIDHVLYYAHRLAWLWMTGQFPDEIDHMNGKRADNKWSNLREVTRSMNNENLRSAKKGNTSGLLGAHFMSSRSCGPKPWKSEIGVNGLRKHLGTFATSQEAHEAYLAAKRELHQGCTI